MNHITLSHSNSILTDSVPPGMRISSEVPCSLDGVLVAILVQVSFFAFTTDFLTNVSLGMKIAKFEIKLILALLLCRYEYKLVDASGKHPKQLPQPNRNDIHQVW